jgi:hypothetical protein
MGVLMLPLVVVLAWVFAWLGWTPPFVSGGTGTEAFAEDAMRWMLLLPAGIQVLVSGIMHTFFAKSTAKNIGWETNGFQYEIGFSAYAMGVGSILAASRGWDTWLVMTAVMSIFLLLCTVQHIMKMVQDKNFKPGNSLILLYDIGLPVSMIGLLVATHSSMT